MRNPIPAGVRAVVIPTLACSIVCGGAVTALAAVGVQALAAPTTAPAGDLAGPGLEPPVAAVVRVPAPPPVTQAPTATEWVVRLPSSR